MYDAFTYEQGPLRCELVSLEAIAAAYGTPTYVYSTAALLEAYNRLDKALADLPHTICYALKANANLAIVKLLADLGAGGDIVSGGELFRAQRAGMPADRIVFAGVAKTANEIEEAMRAKIAMFNVESAGELLAIELVAKRLGTKAPVAIRVNPDVDPDTNPYVATGMKRHKFGLLPDQALKLYAQARESSYLDPIGIQFHIGSQLLTSHPLVEAAERTLALAVKVKSLGIELRYFNIGGGLGISYGNDEPESPEQLAQNLAPLLKDTGYHLIIEPGRYLVGNAGLLLSRVLYRKDNGHKKFVIVDAAMNDLIRPALYDAYHAIRPVRAIAGAEETVDVVGGIGESADFFARSRGLPRMEPGDLVAFLSAGAYGFTMASNYNARPRAPEVLVDGQSHRLIRERETYEDLVRGESL